MPCRAGVFSFLAWRDFRGSKGHVWHSSSSCIVRVDSCAKKKKICRDIFLSRSQVFLRSFFRISSHIQNRSFHISTARSSVLPIHALISIQTFFYLSLVLATLPQAALVKKGKKLSTPPWDFDFASRLRRTLFPLSHFPCQISAKKSLVLLVLGL